MRTIDQQPPRSDETVTRLTSELIAKIRSSTRRAAWWFFVPIGVLGVLLAILCARSADYTVQAGLGMAFMMTSALSVPLIVVLGSKLNDIPMATKLARHAPAYQGDATNREFANVNMLIVAWRENEREDVSYLEVPYALRQFDGNVTVLALPNEESVGILLDENFYLSVRARRLMHRSAPRPSQ